MTTVNATERGARARSVSAGERAAHLDGDLRRVAVLGGLLTLAVPAAHRTLHTVPIDPTPAVTPAAESAH
jgi:hypothetical protein